MDADALIEAARAVRKQLKRLDYVEGPDEPDEEDLKIANVAIASYLSKLIAELRRQQKPFPTEFLNRVTAKPVLIAIGPLVALGILGALIGILPAQKRRRLRRWGSALLKLS